MRTPIVISLGTNLGNREQNLFFAKNKLSKELGKYSESPIVESKAVDYEKQPDFLNQVLLFEEYVGTIDPTDALEICLTIENKLGRKREIDKGPRVIDIDLLFHGIEQIKTPRLQLPHPRLFQRSFIVEPLRELNCFKYLSEHFEFPVTFNNSCQLFPSIQ